MRLKTQITSKYVLTMLASLAFGRAQRDPKEEESGWKPDHHPPHNKCNWSLRENPKKSKITQGEREHSNQ